MVVRSKEYVMSRIWSKYGYYKYIHISVSVRKHAGRILLVNDRCRQVILNA
jgi:hypothetical protein